MAGEIEDRKNRNKLIELSKRKIDQITKEKSFYSIASVKSEINGSEHESESNRLSKK